MRETARRSYSRTLLISSICVTVLGNRPGQSQNLMVRGGKVYTMADAKVLEKGDILIRDGKIAQVGPSASVPSPRGVPVIDAEGCHILPGLIDAHSHMTTQDERGGGSDRHERGQRVNTALRILDSVNPRYGWLESALEGGVTVLLVTPGSNATFGGQIVIIKTVPKPTVDEMLLKRDPGMKMSMAATRGSGTSEMREWFTKGQEYLAKRKRWEESGKEGQEPERNLQLEGIAKQLTGEFVTYMHAQTAIEMQYALKMAREFNLVANIAHGFDGWKMIDDIKKSGVNIIYGPIIFPFADDALYTPGLLAKAGVKVALTMDSASDFQKHHLHQAQIAVRFGMDPMDALEAITINPAEMLRVDDRVGSLVPGKDGDIVVLDGDPLSTFSHVLYTIVDGEIAYQRPGIDRKLGRKEGSL